MKHKTALRLDHKHRRTCEKWGFSSLHKWFLKICSFLWITVHYQTEDGADKQASSWYTPEKKKYRQKGRFAFQFILLFAKPAFHHVTLDGCLWPAAVMDTAMVKRHVLLHKALWLGFWNSDGISTSFSTCW